MAENNGQRVDRSRRTLLKGALLSGSLAGCLGDGSDGETPTPDSLGDGFTDTPTPTPTPIPPSQEAHPLPEDADVLDRIVFGSEPSESNHDLAPETSELVRDHNDALGRHILPGDTPEEDSKAAGSLSFTMKCSPDERTYLTVKIPAQPESFNRLNLVDENDDVVGTIGGSGAWPSIDTRVINGGNTYENGKSCDDWMDSTEHSEYLYLTARLPSYLTDGLDSLTIRFAQLSGDDPPTMPILRAYTHAGQRNAVFDLPTDEAGGHTFETGTPAGAADDPMAPYIERIDSYISNLQSNATVGDRAVHGLALAYSRGDWIESVDQAAILDTVVNTIDDWARKQAESSPYEAVGRGWEEHGHLGKAINLLEEPLREEGLLSAELEDHPEAPIQRSEAYAQFFDAGIEWRTTDLRSAYNQIAIVTVSLLRANRALNALDSDLARDQDQVDHWIDQMIGIKPTGGRGAPYPESGTYHTATEAGITKEAGSYAMHYGALGIHETVKLAHETGLDRVEDRAKEMVEAFGQLRSFAKGGCGSENRTIVADGVIGFRGKNHPGSAGFWRGYGVSPLFNAMVLKEDISKRWAELAIEHDTISVDNWRSRPGSLRRRIPQVEGYRAVTEMGESDYTIPLNREHHLWFDVDAGLVKIHDGETRIVASIPYGASTNAHDHGVNRRCAVHYHDPEQGDRVVQAHVHRLEYPYEGDTWTRPDNLGWASDFLGPDIGHWSSQRFYLPWRDETKELHNAMAGEEVPQTAQPNGEPWPEWQGESSDPRSLSERGKGPYFPGRNEHGTLPGSPDPRVGMGIHYREVTIGPYLIGINSTGNEQRGFGPGREFEMDVPAADVTNFETGETVTGDTVTVPPRSGVVLKRSE